MTIAHKERAHSIFSASGAERWHNCSASVALEEKSPPSKDTAWSMEGTFAHELLERILTREGYKDMSASPYFSSTMVQHVTKTANKIWAIQKAYNGKLLVEKKVFASFLHPEMFGTCDSIIIGDDGTLHIIDFKYGAGHIVDATENLQLLQYALSVADSYNWDFHTIKMWVLQPRAGGNWHKSWTITMEELKKIWMPKWQTAVKRVLENTETPKPGSWCHWCRAKNICPAKRETRANKMADVFSKNPLTNEVIKNGIEEKSIKKESGQKIKGKEKEVVFGTLEESEEGFAQSYAEEAEESFY